MEETTMVKAARAYLMAGGDSDIFFKENPGYGHDELVLALDAKGVADTIGLSYEHFIQLLDATERFTDYDLSKWDSDEELREEYSNDYQMYKVNATANYDVIEFSRAALLQVSEYVLSRMNADGTDVYDKTEVLSRVIKKHLDHSETPELDADVLISDINAYLDDKKSQ